MMLSFHLLIISIFFTLANSQCLCSTNSEFCVFSSQPNATQTEFSILVKNFKTSPFSYYAFGLGSSMAKAEMYIAWIDKDSLPIIQKRSSTSRAEPTLQTAIQPLTATSLPSTSNDFLIVFSRPNVYESTLTTGVDVNLSQNTPISMIWALGRQSDQPGTFKIHFMKGLAQRVDVFALASNLVVTENGGFVIPKTGNEPPGNAGGEPENLTLQRFMNRTDALLTHGALFVFSWLFFAPIGIFAATFAKNIIPKIWFLVHWTFIGIAFILSIIGFIIVALVVDVERASHFNPANYDSVGGTHIVIGLIVFIGFCVEVGLGMWINYNYDPMRLSRPLRDTIHHWVGRVVAVLAIVNVILGYYTFESIVDIVPLWLVAVGVTFGVFCVVLISLGGFFPVLVEFESRRGRRGMLVNEGEVEMNEANY